MEDIRTRLQKAAARLAATREAMRPYLDQEQADVEERDRLIREALEYGIHPTAVIQDSGVSKSRMYQIISKGR